MDIVRALEQELEQAKKQVNALGRALEAFRSTLTRNQRAGAGSSKTAGKKRHMSAAARKRISLAQKARWAKQKAKA
jgi:hypothetical protein